MIYRILFLILTVLFLGCQSAVDPTRDKEKVDNLQMMDDSLLNYNRNIVEAERQEIDDFINRYKWEMQMTSTGLRYMVYQKSSGLSPKQGASVSISYSIKLLNGNLVYQSNASKPVTFTIGKGEVTNGLEEGVLLMKQDERAKFVVPSHLAFGLLGDLDKIPNRAILVYDVELIHVVNKTN